MNANEGIIATWYEICHSRSFNIITINHISLSTIKNKNNKKSKRFEFKTAIQKTKLCDRNAFNLKKKIDSVIKMLQTAFFYRDEF